MTLIEEILYKVEFRDVEGQEKAVLDRSDWEKLVTILELVDQKGQDFGYASEQAMVEKVDLTLDQLLAGVTEENLHGEISTGSRVGAEDW